MTVDNFNFNIDDVWETAQRIRVVRIPFKKDPDVLKCFLDAFVKSEPWNLEIREGVKIHKIENCTLKYVTVKPDCINVGIRGIYSEEEIRCPENE